MRAAIYARYSSELQSASSIEDQVRRCRELVASRDWSLAGVYEDKAASGASALRPGYQKLLAAAEAGQFDVIVSEALDRVSRDLADVAALHKRLKFLGIRLVTAAEGEIGDLHVGLKGTMNALFLQDLADKTRRGLAGRVRAKRSGGGLCYGYDVVRAIGPDGQPARGGRAINGSEAAIVRRIFQAFAAGASPTAITKRLNAERVPGPGGRPWIDTTIRGNHRRGTGILRNELYAGRLVWNRLRYVKDPKTGKRVSRLNPPDKWIHEDVPELRIVDGELWDKVQARLETIHEGPGPSKLRASRFWEKRRAKHLLSGLAVCGTCGKPLAAVGKDYLACNYAQRRGTCTNTRSLRRGMLEDLILSALKERLMAPALVKAFIAAFHEEVNRQRASEEATRKANERELIDIERKIERIVDAIAEGTESASLTSKLAELEQRRDDLARHLRTAPAPPVRLHPNLAELYRQKVENLRAALADHETRTEALEILRSLIERVVLHPVDGGNEIELVGAIAKMVTIANEPETKNKKAAPGRAAFYDHRRSVKVVAGAGFEPTTFRL